MTRKSEAGVFLGEAYQPGADGGYIGTIWRDSEGIAIRVPDGRTVGPVIARPSKTEFRSLGTLRLSASQAVKRYAWLGSPDARKRAADELTTLSQEMGLYGTR